MLSLGSWAKSVNLEIAFLRACNPVERLALLCVSLTPVALLLDYRLGFHVWSDAHTWRPLGYGGLLASATDVIGATQILWIAGGITALTRRGLRRGFFHLTPILLSALVVLLLAATAIRSRVDQFTVFALVGSLVPLIGMTGLLANPGLRPRVVRLLVTIYVGMVAIIVAATLLKNGLGSLRGIPVGSGRTLRDRFDLYLAGSYGPTSGGALLAGVVALAPVMRRRSIQIAALVVLLPALVLTQTRGALIAVVAAAVVYGLLSDARWRLPILIAIPALAIVFVLVSHRPLTSISDASNVVRRQNIVHHLALFQEHPLLGFGLSERSLPAVRAAHDTQLGIANAAGVLGALLWALAWALPLLRGLGRASRDPAHAAGAAVLTATIVTWSTTGNEVLISVPPTNLLPVALGVALGMTTALAPVTSRRLTTDLPAPKWRWLPAAAFALLWLGLLVAPLVALAGTRDTLNLVRSSSFEVGALGWRAFPTAGKAVPSFVLSKRPEHVGTGKYALLVIARNASARARVECLVSTTILVHAHQSYYLRAKVSGRAAVSSPIRLGTQITGRFSQRNIAAVREGITIVHTGNEVKLEGFYTPEASSHVRLALCRRVAARAAAYFAVDDVMLVRGSRPVPFVSD